MNMVEDFSHDAPSSMILQPVRGMNSLDGHGPMDGYSLVRLVVKSWKKPSDRVQLKLG